MQTNFTLEQLANPDMAASEKILRACVHCGFCTATCPTFVLLGDELDSPRGRIYLIKDMLENDKPASPEVVKHVDRCLSCLSCMTTCPSGVHYMHLVDHARKHIEETFERPRADRGLRSLLAFMLPDPGLFRLSLLGAWFAKPFARFFEGRDGIYGRLGAMLRLAPSAIPSPSWMDRPGIFPAEGERRARVALMTGCAQQVLAPSINEATIRLLNRHGVEVVIPQRTGCCGALVHHMGKEAEALESARRNIDGWRRERDLDGLDAIIINASGCGTTVKDYGFMLRGDEGYAAPAKHFSTITRDITEFMDELGLLPAVRDIDLAVTYHSACSLQHGQKVTAAPKALLTQAGFTVKEVPEGHLCCGSAGTYNIMQPKIATELRDRKVANIEKTAPDLVAAGNIGCITQIASGTDLPVVHTVELLDWATGGPAPAAAGGVDFAEETVS
ncbi:MAG: heterodisulfide reductase-related iron-sulfur binding cluster [Pseudomonadota bacterium]